ncbi:MAG: chemotaxis protein CheW [Deltaproteobacteria bacterium]|nr:chemotaxis protein CheW [Deltaproteobacteria bacterium]TLN02953.1 MAG: chemotaxis protein CheW [bacterium]
MDIREIESRQYLTFRLAKETFAVDVAKVREILDFVAITKVPQTPDFMRGVINLRGSVVPVVDMKLKFGMEPTEKTVNTCIIVLEVTIENETTIVGALADSVQEVVELDPSQIEPPPRIGMKLSIDFIKGMGKLNDDFVIILDTDKIFSFDEGTVLAEMTDSNAA